MRIVKSLMNRSEEVVFRELEKIASDNSLRVFAKTRLSDVLETLGETLPKRQFDYFTRSHFDFVLTTDEFRPVMGIEYDGPTHSDPKQIERDRIKGDLCEKAGFGLLRIHSKHVTRLYRGMTLLRWIVEVYELQKWFDRAQEEGQVPCDEDFDPLLLDTCGKGRRFPYWLSAPAMQHINGYLRERERDAPSGWFSLLGRDGDDKLCKLSYIRVGDDIIFAHTYVRQQSLNFHWYTLLDEINGCELGLRLSKFQRGEIGAISVDEFRRKFEEFCRRFDASPSHSMGKHPFQVSWNGREWHW